MPRQSTIGQRDRLIERNRQLEFPVAVPVWKNVPAAGIQCQFKCKRRKTGIQGRERENIGFVNDFDQIIHIADPVCRTVFPEQAFRHDLIIDEAQNLTPKQAKGIITRAGMGTKIILLGDPNQIDHPLLDERTNGLCYAAEKMKGSPLCYQITLSAEECERSPLAMDAVLRM